MNVRLWQRKRGRMMAAERLERRLALAVATPFAPRFTANTTGDITIAANTLMTAGSGTPTEIANAQNGIGSKVNNNDFTMTFVNIDSSLGLFNSSSADVVTPAGAEVLWAGLYWGGRTDSSTPNGQTSQRLNVKFQAPGDSTYQDLTGTLIGTTSSSYQAFKDVTSLVQNAGGAGTYSVGNVQAISNKSDYYAGWSLVVAYRAQGEPPRNLTVFDGYASVTSSDPAVTIPISGFKAPPSGPVKATLGFVTYEGDLGYTGDTVKFKSGSASTATTLSDAANPANNFFNSTISNRGSLVSTKTPDYVNQMGFDADLVKADGIIRNSDTSATISLSTGGETYYPGVVTSAIDLYAPNIIVDKAVENLSRPTDQPAQPGDTLRYTITVRNDTAVNDTAVNVLLNDVIPIGLQYKPGTLAITSGANAGPKTDAQDGDQAEVMNAGESVRFQLGTGAGGFGTPGGSLAPGASTTVTFEVTVGSGILSQFVIDNVADVSYQDSAKIFNLVATGSASISIFPEADISVTKVDVPARGQYVPGQTVTYEIVVTNNSPTVDVTGIQVFDEAPPQVTEFTWTAVYSAGSSGALSGTGNIDELIDLKALGTATFTVTAPVRAGSFGNLSNSVTVTPPGDVFDPDETNNTATDINTLRAPANLQVAKSVVDNNGDTVAAGDILTYTIIVTNPGTNPDAPNEDVIDVMLSDVVPTNTTFDGNLTTTQGDVEENSGTITGNLGTIAMGGSVTITFDVRVDNPIADGTVIENTAMANGTGAISDLLFNAEDSVGVVTPPGADLRIVKTAPATFVAGQPITFTITVTNVGPSDVTGATVTDVVDARISGVTWTATYSSGSTGPGSGSGNAINASIDLMNGGTATFTVTGMVASTFPDSDTLTNTAEVTNPGDRPDPNPQDNTSTTESTPTALTDLAAAKTSSAPTYTPGQPITYTITVTNNGPSFASQASVIDTLDLAIVSSASWTAVFSGTGSAGNMSGTGSIDEIVNLAAGGTVVYTVIAQTRSAATATLVNSVTANVSKYSNDPDPTNNTSTVSAPPNFAPAVIVGSAGNCDSMPLVRVLDPTTGAVKAEFLAYEPSFRGGVSVYGADLTGDGVEEIITGSGPGRPGEVRVFTQNGVELPAYRTFPYGRGFTGGVEVASGPVTALGAFDLVTAQASGGNLVRVFSVTPGAADPVANTASRQFRPFGPAYTGGARLATADIGTFSGSTPLSTSPDGIFEIIAGSGVGGRATVVAQNAVPPATARIGLFNPIAPTYARGVTVARMPGSGGAADSVLVAGGVGSGSRVETWSYTTTPTRRFVRDAFFAAYPGTAAAVGAAALDASNVFSVQGTAGKTAGVKKFTSISGAGSSTLPSSTSVMPPQRISVLRR